MVYPLHHRWVLFEEKFEVGAGRWSAPHVPAVALSSLQKLRSLLAKGLVLLDCPAQSLLELVGTLGAFAERAWAAMSFHQDFPPQSLGTFQSPPRPAAGDSIPVTGERCKRRAERAGSLAPSFPETLRRERDLGRGEGERLGAGSSWEKDGSLFLQSR